MTLHRTIARCTPVFVVTLLAVGCNADDQSAVTSSATTAAPPATIVATTVEVTTTTPAITIAPTTSTTDVTVPPPVVVGGDTLSDRQQELVATVDEYFEATAAGRTRAQKVIDLFESFGQVTWYNGEVYRVADGTLWTLVKGVTLPRVDRKTIETAIAPSGEVSHSRSQLVVFDNQVVWTGDANPTLNTIEGTAWDPGTGYRWVMVFSFEPGSTRIATLYLSPEAWPTPDSTDPAVAWSRDSCQETPTAVEVQALLDLPPGPRVIETPDCFHFWAQVTDVFDSSSTPCKKTGFTGIYSTSPDVSDVGTEVLVWQNDKRGCLVLGPVAEGDLVEVWAVVDVSHMLGLVSFQLQDIEVFGHV